MPEFKWKTPKASYLSELNEGIQIRSPISLTEPNKGPIGIHLQGLQRPNRRMILKFHPRINVSINNLLWTLDGAILYSTFPETSTITCGRILGNLTLHKHSQFAFLTITCCNVFVSSYQHREVKYNLNKSLCST